ncbi:ribosomal protein L14 (mitochondrion) [Dictyostelium discoideum]|uniref:Large ribosomal subunit protein uL14m n=1 Tax=Dictyostelium discoideum TaxID=44689 RepID=RM14_DICDI|nr:ribosomal protein L14 [Dictyostelium discoideum]O21033.1 RecName: Full=Large ribosomal subunit protein uL14m; AltName: Full=60S ribosomal protein L14, mitochondrial [Dictyostelium discoideum]BAA23570.1 ribosomal protein L14 [Dictyostelium discoideum]BAA78078.1 ribosomal protein L14 [Dictyostelium discoideum]|eukprot:NP_050096.1 ribosomal protein L14 (mitochondrion) [Dictyostelium discoideum]
MIIKGSNFSVMDNSGARKVQCIQTLEGKKPTSLLRVGDKIVVVIKKMEKRKGGKYKLKVKKSDVCYAVIVKSKQPVRRKSGIIVNAGENGVILLTKTKEPIGTRLTGVVFKEVQRTGLLKNVSISKYII